MTAPKRIAQNWLKMYLDWTLPRSEAPQSMVLWAGIFTIASVLKRKVCFPRQLMGSYEIFPNFYTIFVGQPGVVRKSTTAGYAEELLVEVSQILSDETINLAPTSVSASKLLEVLAKTSDSSLTVVSSEFSSFIGPTRDAMYDLLTDIYDGKRKFDYLTRAHGTELSEKPVVNLLAATTPAWVASQPSSYFLGGGFASRVVFIFEQFRRRYKMYFDDVDYKKIDLIGKGLLNDLQIIASMEGEFRHETKELKEEMENWYQGHAKATALDPRMEGYHQRKHVHVHKLAMCLSAAERSDLVTTKAHFEASKLLLQELEEKMPRAIASVGSNPIGHHLYEMRDFIEEKGIASRKQVLSRFIRDLKMSEISELIAALHTLGDIKIIPNGTNPSYEALRKKV